MKYSPGGKKRKILALRKLRTNLQHFSLKGRRQFSGKNLFCLGEEKKNGVFENLKRGSLSPRFIFQSETSAALYTALQNVHRHFCFVFFKSTFNSAPPLLLLGLLVQLHVRHQDVLLRLLRQAGVGAAVAGTFVGAPGPNRSPAVQVDDDGDQRHQEQRRHQDHNQRGQMVNVHWGRGHRRGSHPTGNV